MLKSARACLLAVAAVLLASCETTEPDLAPRLTLEGGGVAAAAAPVVVTATARDDRELAELVVDWGDGGVETVPLAGDSVRTAVQHAFATLGTFEVRATLSDGSGQSVRRSVEVEVGAASVVVEPAGGDTINALGFTAALTVRGYDAAGAELPDFQPAWSSLDAGVATVDPTGTVTAVAVGEARIRAASGLAEDTVVVLVRQVPKAVVLTAPDTLAVRETASLAVAVTDSNDVAIAAAELALGSTAPAVATIDAEGRVVGAGEGTTLVTAAAGPAADTATVEVALGVLFAGEPEADHAWSDLFTITRHGTERRNITNLEFTVDADGVWSPDRTRIAFSSHRDPHAILIADPDGSNVVSVPTGLTQPPNDLAWSPDGERFAFGAWDDAAVGQVTHIYLIHVDGSGLTQLTTEAVEHRHPAWSPDGTRLALTRIVHGDGTATIDVLVMDADGSNVVNLTDGIAGGHQVPVWSPDGTEIAFTSGMSNPGSIQIHRMNADGSNIRQIGVHSVVDFDWSPDGALFVFATEHVDGQRDIFSMPADGGELTRITNDALWEQDVRWR